MFLVFKTHSLNESRHHQIQCRKHHVSTAGAVALSLRRRKALLPTNKSSHYYREWMKKELILPTQKIFVLLMDNRVTVPKIWFKPDVLGQF